MSVKKNLTSRRAFIVSSAAALLAGCNTSRPLSTVAGRPYMRGQQHMAPTRAPIPDEYLYMYGPKTDEPYPLPAVDLRRIDPVYYRQVVDYPTTERVGTLIVDTPNRFLYLVMEGGRALRYGVGIGREGFTWGGSARIAYKKAWPTWTPPAEMIARQPELEEFRKGMKPGLQNPLGARALYIFQGNKDTLYRIHGTNQPWTIGTAVSSGCVRLMNQDIIDLYNRVPNDTPVIVRQA